MGPTRGADFVWRLDDELPSHEGERRKLQKRGYDLIVTRGATYREDYAKYAPYAKAILLQVSFPFRAEDIEGLTSCKIITVTAGGYNNIDVHAATRKGIIVTYVPGYCVEEVSDHVLGLIIALNHRFPACQEMTRKGIWDAIEIGPFRRFQTQILGIIGFGRIGKNVARKAKCLGLTVKVYDPYIPESNIKAQGVEWATFDELVSTSDYLSLHVLLTEETYHLINAKVFDSMKSTAYLINTCRGDVVDEWALIQALETKKIAGAGLDVLAKEPPDPKNPLLLMPNVIVTPHSAFISQEAMMEIEVRIIKAVTDVLEGRIPEDIVNPEVLNRVGTPKGET